MRAEEKIDPELEHEESHDKVEELEEERPVEEDKVDEVETSAIHFHELVAFLDALLRGQAATLDLAWASDRERQALELVTQAIEGHRVESIRTLFAEDRLQMLNQALAALQPALVAGLDTATAEARYLYATLVEEVGDFKQSLESLTDAQEEIFAHDEVREGADDKPGKPKPKPVDPGEVGDVRPSTLAGPGPAVEKPAPPTTLVGPGPAVDKPVPPTTLTGPGPAVELIDPPTTLTGPGAAPDKKPQPSAAWDGEPGGDRPRR